MCGVRVWAGEGVLDLLHGSTYLVWWFRALGAQIGREVCLYPRGADPMMTEPDLVQIGNFACIDSASVIAHINSRGSFALNAITIGPAANLRAGAFNAWWWSAGDSAHARAPAARMHCRVGG